MLRRGIIFAPVGGTTTLVRFMMKPANTPAAPKRDTAKAQALAVLEVMFGYYDYNALPLEAPLARAA